MYLTTGVEATRVPAWSQTTLLTRGFWVLGYLGLEVFGVLDLGILRLMYIWPRPSLTVELFASRASWAFQNFTKPFRSLPGLLRPSRTFKGHFKRAFQDLLRAFWESSRPFVVFQDLQELSRIFMGLQGTFQALQGASKSLLGPSWAFNGLPDPSKAFQSRQGHSRAFKGLQGRFGSGPLRAECFRVEAREVYPCEP